MVRQKAIPRRAPRAAEHGRIDTLHLQDMPALYLTEADVAGLVAMPRVIEIMAEAFARLAAGEAMNVPRVRAQGKGIILHSMSAAADYLGLVGWKQYTTTKSGAKFLVGLHN